MECKTKIVWQRHHQIFIDNRYSRAHQWMFDEGIVVPASSSPTRVAIPYSNAAAVDPEEAFVASIASCHMLWFLSIAAKNKYCVDQYLDEAHGRMEKNSENEFYIAQVELRPQIQFSSDHIPDTEAIYLMHEEAHRKCFIANSVNSNIIIKPVFDNANADEIFKIS